MCAQKVEACIAKVGSYTDAGFTHDICEQLSLLKIHSYITIYGDSLYGCPIFPILDHLGSNSLWLCPVLFLVESHANDLNVFININSLVYYAALASPVISLNFIYSRIQFILYF